MCEIFFFFRINFNLSDLTIGSIEFDDQLETG